MMSVSEAPNSSLTHSAAPQQSGQSTSARGRGCKIGRGLPLQQRKVYRNLARQTPRVQGLTFDHNQIRWISYWKNDQNKQVQKHFPVSRYGFLGARRLALEERNRIMGKPPDTDEAAEAIANLKVDPSIPCFLEWNSPSQNDEVQAVEVEDEVTCTSAETWPDDEGDSQTDAHRSETTEAAGASEDSVTVPPLLPTELAPGQIHALSGDAASSSSANPTVGDCQTAPKRPSAESVDSSDALNPNFHSFGTSKKTETSVSLRSMGKRCAVGAPAEVFPRSCKMEEVNDEFLTRSITRTTTAAPDSCTDRHFMTTDRTTSLTSACFEEPDMAQEGCLATISPQNERRGGSSTDVQHADTFKRPVPPALPSVGLSWEEKVAGFEISTDTGPMSLFCTADGERRNPCASPTSFLSGPRRLGVNGFESAGHPVCDAFVGGGYFSPRAASSDGGSPTQRLSAANTMREVFEFWDSKKDLCASLVHDLFQGMRSSGMHLPKGSSCLGGGMMPSDLRCRDFLEREEAMHSLVIEEAKGLDQLEPYLEIFRHCLVGGLMPSQLPLGEMISMVWTLRYRLLVPWAKPNAVRSSEYQFGMPPQCLSPFRERQGMTHRLLTEGVNLGGHQTIDLSPTSAALGLGSPTAAVGRTSGFIAPPSLFFGPSHAPSSPTAALYGGCFFSATEQDHHSAAV